MLRRLLLLVLVTGVLPAVATGVRPAPAAAAGDATIVDLGAGVTPLEIGSAGQVFLTKQGIYYRWVDGTASPLQIPADPDHPTSLHMGSMGSNGAVVGSICYETDYLPSRCDPYQWSGASTTATPLPKPSLPADATNPEKARIYALATDATGEVVGYGEWPSPNSNGGSYHTRHAYLDNKTFDYSQVHELVAVSPVAALGSGLADFAGNSVLLGAGGTGSPVDTGLCAFVDGAPTLATDGTVVGTHSTVGNCTSSQGQQPRMRLPDGTTVDLATDGHPYVTVFGVSATHSPVGVAYHADNTTYAAQWGPDGSVTDLNSRLPAGSGWVLSQAVAIDDAGDIIGTGTLNGAYHAFLIPAGGAFLGVQSATVSEPKTGTVTAQVPVTLSTAQDTPVTVHYATSDGTATTAHGDYVATSGTVTFPPGVTLAHFPVVVNASGLTDEHTVGLAISTPGGADDVQIGKGAATLTISDRPTLGGSLEARPGRPVAGVPVVVSDGTTTTTLTTDAAGHFSTLLDPGDYTVTPQVGDGRWVPHAGGDCVSTGTACQVTLVSGQTAAVDFTAALAVDSVTLQQPAITGSGADGPLGDVPASGTYDGNTLTVKVTLSNTATTALTTGLALGRPVQPADDAAPALTHVTGLPATVTVPAGGTKTVTGRWDTTGTAWAGPLDPDPQHLVRATLDLTPSTYAQQTVTVRPKPVVLVHGLASSAATWDAYVGPTGWLHQANPLWQGFAVGDAQVAGALNTDPFDDAANSIAVNAGEEARYVRGVRSLTDAEHVDIVAHSMGGLISRQYVASLMPAAGSDDRPVADHLVMLGTPNQGSPCAYAGTLAVHGLGLDHLGYGLPVAQLQPDFMAAFNQSVSARKGVAFSILAGHSVPSLCGVTEWSDQVVPVSSALWTITDRTVVNGLLHTQMEHSNHVFRSWVLPHLAIAGGASGSRSASAAAASPVVARRGPSCRATTGGVSGVADSDHLVLRHQSKVEHFTVARATRLDVVLLHEPGLTATLKGPGARRTVAAGSRADDGLFTTLSVPHPRPGAWTLTFATRDRSLPVGFTAVEVKPATGLTVTTTSVKGVAVRLRAVLRGPGRKVEGTRVAAQLVVGAKRHRVVLRPVPGHRGSWAAAIPAAYRTPTLQALVTATGRGFDTTTLLTGDRACR